MLFRRLSMQVTMDYEEVKYIYLKGLNPRIRELVRTKDGIRDIRTLMLAYLKLDTRSEKPAKTSEAYTVDNSNKSSSTNWGNYHEQGQDQKKHCNICKENGHYWQQCLKCVCFICDKKGHTMKKCPNLKFIRESMMKTTTTSSSVQANLVQAQTNLVTVNDSGATQHMFNCLDFFGTTTERNSRVKYASN